MGAGSLFDLKKKLSAFMTGQSIPEYYSGLWKSLELKFPSGCQNILDTLIVCVPCTLPSAIAAHGKILSKTKSFQWAPGQQYPNSLGVWSPPDKQPHSCEKATTALWKEECFCSVSSYTVMSVPFAWLTLHFQEKLWHCSSMPVRLSPCR